MFFAIIGIGFHQLAALVAARAGMLCFQLAKSLDTIHDRQTEELPRSVNHQPSTTDIYSKHDSPQIEEPLKSTSYLQFSDIQYFLILCEKLQLVATTVYLPSALMLIFYMFHKKELAIAIYVITGVSALVVYRLGFWKISVLWNSLGEIGSKCREMILSMGRMGRKY